MNSILSLSGGYNYQTKKRFEIQTSLRPERTVYIWAKDGEYWFAKLATDGKLIVEAGYSWDGMRGIPDLKYFMVGSLVHDVLYQMLRQESLDQSFREQADDELRKIIINVSKTKNFVTKAFLKVSAETIYIGVRKFSEKYARKRKEIINIEYVLTYTKNLL
jgi:hypothetical protein